MRERNMFTQTREIFRKYTDDATFEKIVETDTLNEMLERSVSEFARDIAICDNGNEYPRFCWYRYGIKDVTGILRDLELKGFVSVGDISDAVRMEKLPAIKEELKKREQH